MYNQDSQFARDIQDNSCNVNRGMYNLICSKRDLRLYTKGIKPHRNWKITNVKKYFDIKGSAEVMLEQLTELYNHLTSEEK